MTVTMDDPPVAGIEDGGPLVASRLLVKPGDFRFEVVQGFFLQNGPKGKSLDFEELLERSFGLIDTSPERWQNLKASIAQLQLYAPEDVQYKVFFLGRHGQGWHNAAVDKYGVEAWESSIAFETNDDEMTWGPDPELSPLGISQAQAVHRCWHEQAPLGAPITADEMRWYVSPLTRTGQTLLLTWGEMLAGTPECWEDWREIYGCHTCDKRSSKTHIRKRFPMFAVEDDMTEEDELWKPDERETDEHMQMRMTRALDRVFGEGGASETYISITGHSAIFTNLLVVLNHQPYPLATGEMIPVVVKATRLRPSA